MLNMSERLQDMVSAQAKKTPDSRAVVFGKDSLTYAQLDIQSNRLGRMLQAEGCQTGDRVALVMPKSIEAIVGMLGVLKAGCIYVPIDLDSPSARVQRIFSASDPKAVLVAKAGSNLLDDCLSIDSGQRKVISTEPGGISGAHFESNHDFSGLESFESNSLNPDTSNSDIAHLLFTSGSTGTPKGVMITHRNVASFVNWASRYFEISEGDQISGHPPLHFDLSTFDIFGSLSRGATLHLVPPQLNLMAAKMAEWMRVSQLTQWFSVPSILTYMAKFDVVKANDFPALKRLLWCGEVLPTPTLRYWMERLPHVTFTNLYGPTEATIASSYYTVTHPPADDRESIPIGTPCGGEELLVVKDDNLQPAEPGTTGELHIRGTGLSPGYWQDTEKTSQAFVMDPSDPTVRSYRTGDLGKVDEDGLFHYVGRLDSQIKSRGHRIELGEIETALNAFECLRESAVVGVETGGFEGTLICCAYAANSDEDVTPADLRKQLSALVPRYMLPSRWQCYDRLAKNANGKIDKRKIREAFASKLLDNNSRLSETSNQH